MVESALVYDRIDANRRATRMLSAIFVLAICPFAVFWLQYLMEVAVIFVPGILSMEFPTALIPAVAIALVCTGVLVSVEYKVAASRLLNHFDARLITPGSEPTLERCVENLCIGSGLPLPRIRLMETPAANAFSTGMRPDRSYLVVTRGLLDTVDRRELEAVVAHELAHIGSGDARLGTLRAAFIATAWLPARVVAWPVRLGFRLHWIVGSLLLLWLGSGIAGMLSFGIQIAIIDPRVRPFFLVGFPLLVYCFLGAPLLASLVARRLMGERDFLADGEAVLLTRNPTALGTALTKLSVSGLPVVPAGAATAHLWFVPPRQLGGHWWQLASLAMGPPVVKRIDRILQLSPFGSER